MMSAPSSASRTAWLRPCPCAAPVISATAPVDPSHACSFRGVTESGQPQTSLATSTTSSSLRHWSSSVRSLPWCVLEKPHCGLNAS